jgi:hypothetical protein
MRSSSTAGAASSQTAMPFLFFRVMGRPASVETPDGGGQTPALRR